MNSFYEMSLRVYIGGEENGDHDAGGYFFKDIPTKESINKAIDSAELRDREKDGLRKLIEPCETFEVGKGNSIDIGEYDTLSFEIIEHKFEDADES